MNPDLLLSFRAARTAFTEETDMTNRHSRAQWMADGSYGMMVHYVLGAEEPQDNWSLLRGLQGDAPEEKTADFNRMVNGFDADSFVNQFLSTGADWLFFTIGQNTGYYCSPNEVLDTRSPGYTSQRDLVLEIGERLKAEGKRLVLYLPAETAEAPAEIQEGFGWNPVDPTEYFKRYLAFIREYSLRLGTLHDGWWFDGCFPHVLQSGWDWAPWCEASRAGNPDSAIAFSDASFCIGTLPPVTPLQDYHAGEVHILEDAQIRMDFLSGDDVYTTPEGRIRKRGQEPRLYMPDSQFIDGVQWHALVPIDSSFNPIVPAQHYSDDALFKFVKDCNAVKGGVTLNVPVDNKGYVPDATIAQLKRLSRSVCSDSPP